MLFKINLMPLDLLIFSEVYETRDAEEPAFQYVLDVPHVPLAVPKADALSESILLLAETLESGSAMQQFEQLYRKKPGLSADESKKQENVTKNRYRDISPCMLFPILLFWGYLIDGLLIY